MHYLWKYLCSNMVSFLLINIGFVFWLLILINFLLSNSKLKIENGLNLYKVLIQMTPIHMNDKDSWFRLRQTHRSTGIWVQNKLKFSDSWFVGRYCFKFLRNFKQDIWKQASPKASIPTGQEHKGQVEGRHDSISSLGVACTSSQCMQLSAHFLMC